MKRVKNDVRDLSDETLALAKAGNKAALGLVFRNVDGLLRWRANKYPVGQEDREDLLSIGYLAVFDALRTYRPGAGRFVSWVTQWAHARMWTSLQVQKRRGASLNEYAVERAHEELPANPDEVLAAEGTRDEVQRAVKKLPVRLREVMRGRMAGKTLESIGDAVDLSRERIRQMEALALDKVRRELARRGAA
jgi:RNA polymerase sigma factor (sigma-70 family)